MLKRKMLVGAALGVGAKKIVDTSKLMRKKYKDASIKAQGRPSAVRAKKRMHDLGYW